MIVSVCLSADISQEPHDQTFPNFLLLVTHGHGSVLLYRRWGTLYVLPVLWMTSLLHITDRNRRREKAWSK